MDFSITSATINFVGWMIASIIVGAITLSLAIRFARLGAIAEGNHKPVVNHVLASVCCIILTVCFFSHFVFCTVIIVTKLANDYREIARAPWTLP